MVIKPNYRSGRRKRKQNGKGQADGQQWHLPALSHGQWGSPSFSSHRLLGAKAPISGPFLWGTPAAPGFLSPNASALPTPRPDSIHLQVLIKQPFQHQQLVVHHLGHLLHQDQFPLLLACLLGGKKLVLVPPALYLPEKRGGLHCSQPTPLSNPPVKLQSTQAWWHEKALVSHSVLEGWPPSAR